MHHKFIQLVLYPPILIISLFIAGLLTSGSIDPGHWNILALIIWIIIVCILSHLLNKLFSQREYVNFLLSKISDISRNNHNVTFYVEHSIIDKYKGFISADFSSSNTADEFVKLISAQVD